MSWTHDDHEKSAIDAIKLGLMRGELPVLAAVPEPQQSSEHQARVTAITTWHNIMGDSAIATHPWTPTMYDWTEPPVEPPVEPPTEWPVRFMDYPRSDAISLSGVSGTADNPYVIENLSF